jgi:23S rRNA (uracil1939-C5)-methyltransferase
MYLKPEKWVNGGYTLGYWEGKTCFLTGGIPGVAQEFVIEKEKSKIIYARAKEALDVTEISGFEANNYSNLPSQSRCNLFPICGGCSYRHISYSEELEIKRRQCASALDPPETEIKIFSDLPIGYRNNVQWQRERGRDRKVNSASESDSGEPRAKGKDSTRASDSTHHLDRIGYFQRNSHSLVDLRDKICPNLPSGLQVSSIIESELANLSKNSVSKRPPLRGNQKNTSGLAWKFRSLDGSLLSLRNYETQSDEYIWEGKKFKIPKNGFFQINRFLIPKWLERFQTYIPNQISECLELFCGMGIIGQSLSDKIQSLVGWEGASGSIAAAIQNAKENNLKNYLYEVKNLHQKIEIKTKLPNRLWILNPPREGAGENVQELIKLYKPQQVIYSSCDVETLKRDLQGWKEVVKDIKIKNADLFDFFPRTKHFETVLNLELQY